MKRILVVDDSLTSRMFVMKCVTMALPQEKIEFVQAKDGEDALGKLGEKKPDLILSDINMPNMNGFTFIRNIKDNPFYKDIPIIFISSLANDGRMDNLLQIGAFDVIKKPINPASLMKVFDKLFKKENKSDDGAWG